MAYSDYRSQWELDRDREIVQARLAKPYRPSGLEVSRSKPNTLVCEAESPEGKKLGIAPQQFMYAPNPEKPDDAEAAIKRFQVITCASNLRDMGKETRAYFNGQDVTKTLTETLDACIRGEIRISELPIIELPKTHRRPAQHATYSGEHPLIQRMRDRFEERYSLM